MADIDFTQVGDEVLSSGYHLGPPEKIVDGQTFPNTVAPIGNASLRGTANDKQSRWGVVPLYTNYHEHAFVGEYLCDPNTGEPAIKREDGSVVNVSEIARIYYHLDMLTNALSYLGMRQAKIFSVEPENDSTVPVYNGNCIDEDTVLSSDTIIKKMVMSFDISVMTKIEGSSLLRSIDEDPIIKIEYVLGGETTVRTLSYKMSEYRGITIPINEKRFTLKKISIPSADASGYACFIHSIFVAY